MVYDDIKIMKCLDVGATACVIYLVEEEDELTGFKKKKRRIKKCCRCRKTIR